MHIYFAFEIILIYIITDSKVSNKSVVINFLNLIGQYENQYVSLGNNNLTQFRSNLVVLT